jgi:hypothetical protein
MENVKIPGGFRKATSSSNVTLEQLLNSTTKRLRESKKMLKHFPIGKLILVN